MTDLMAIEQEIQRIVLLDGPAVLGDPANWPTTNSCIRSMSDSLTRLRDEGAIRDVDPEAVARVLNGALTHASLWIANSTEPEATSRKAVEAIRQLLDGLLPQERKAP